MRRFLYFAGGFLCLTLVLGAVALIYLLNADLSRHRHWVESQFLESTGRHLTIDGRFEPSLGRTSRLIAEGISISNAPWSDHPNMVAVERVELEVDTLSILFRPILVQRLQLRGTRISLEREPDRPPNWALGVSRSSEFSEAGIEPGIVLRSVNFEDLAVSYSDAIRSREQDLIVDHLTVNPDAAGMLAILIDARFNALPLEVDGTLGPIRSLLAEQNIEVDITASWGDLSGRLWGTVADAERRAGVQAELRGPTIETTLEALNLPVFASGAVVATGRVTPAENTSVFQSDISMGEFKARIEGQLDKAQTITGMSVALTLPDARAIGGLIGDLNAPAEPLEVSAIVEKSADGYAITDSRVQIGRHQAQILGTFEATDGIKTADLGLTGSGPDMAALGSIWRVEGLPDWKYEVSGKLRKSPDQPWRAEALRLLGGGNDLVVTGELPVARTLDGLNLLVRMTGSDMAQLTSEIGLPNLGAGAFVFSSQLVHQGKILELRESALETDSFTATGRIGVSLEGDAADTFFELHLEGPDLATATRKVSLPVLDAGSFTFDGRITQEGKTLAFGDSVLSTDKYNATGSGTLTPGKGFAGTSFHLSIEGQDLNDLPGVNIGDALVDGEYRLAGMLTVTTDAFELESIKGVIGNAAVSGNGRIIRSQPRSQWTVNASGPNLALFSSVHPFGELAGESFSATGQVNLGQGTVAFEPLKLQMGDVQILLNGTANRSADLPTSYDMEFEISAPSVRRLASLPDVLGPLEIPVSLRGQMLGTAQRFELSSFQGQAGQSQLEGNIQADLSGKPKLKGKMAMSHLDLTGLPLWERNRAVRNDPAKVLSDDPIEFSWLNAGDVDVSIVVDDLSYETLSVANLETELAINEGGLEISRMAFQKDSAAFDLETTLKPIDVGFDFEAHLQARNIRLAALTPEGENQTVVPPLDADLTWKSNGRSAADMAGSANGSASMVLGAGRVDSKVLDRILADFFSRLLRTLNPLSVLTKDQAFVEIECGRYDFAVEDGLATTRKLGLKAKSVAVVGSGTVDLSTEELDLAIRAVPTSFGLEGLGNEFFKVGGTLAEPRGELDQIGSVTTTGKAVATGGLSLLARGIFGKGRSLDDICGPVQ